MKNLAIARRYAKALLMIGKEDGQTETYKEELSGIAELIQREKALEQALANPLYYAAGRRKVLVAVIDKMNLSTVMNSFLLLVFEKDRMAPAFSQ